MNSGINILFYSRGCDTCKNLISVLQNEGLINHFKMFCVDDKLSQLPPQITMVPTMIVSNINRPLVAEETFDWIKQIKFIRKQQNNQNVLKNNLMNMNINMKKNPAGYEEDAMGGVSDKFAHKDIDKALPHTYFGLGKEDKNVIFTAPEQNKLSKDDQIKKIKEVEANRNDQETQYQDIMKKQHLEAMLKYESGDNANGNSNTNNYNRTSSRNNYRR